MTGWHLAALNVAKMAYPLEDPRMADFVDNLDPINTLGDESPGFVHRHQTDEGDATAERIFDDPDILMNFTMWESVEALHEYVYSTEHVEFLRRRREWFVPLDDLPVLVMWWVPAGTIPTLDQAKTKLEHLRDHGPTDEAFTFRTAPPPPA